MLNVADDLPPVPAAVSPSDSAISSSDLDTQSTGSFFHDRSTSLGTLLGVSLASVTFRAPSQHRQPPASASTSSAAASRKSKKPKRKVTPGPAASNERRRRWCGLCADRQGLRPASLGDFLEVERRFGDRGLYRIESELRSDARLRRDRSLVFADKRTVQSTKGAGLRRRRQLLSVIFRCPILGYAANVKYNF